MTPAQAVADGRDVHTIYLKYLAETLEMFGDSKDYIYLQKKRLLSTNMMNDTVVIFAELADVAIILLQSTLSRKRESKSITNPNPTLSKQSPRSSRSTSTDSTGK